MLNTITQSIYDFLYNLQLMIGHPSVFGYFILIFLQLFLFCLVLSILTEPRDTYTIPKPYVTKHIPIPTLPKVKAKKKSKLTGYRNNLALIHIIKSH